MKTINETFTDEEYEKIIADKDNLSWHDYIIKLVENQK